MRRFAAIVSLLIMLGSSRRATADDEDLWWVRPSIQIGGHAETGGGVLPHSGFAPKEDGGGVALALALMAPVHARLVAGLAGELSGSHTVLGPQTPVGVQSYSVASVRVMGRVEYWSRPPFDHERHGADFYALLGAGWNYNGVGTTITYLNGAPDGVAGDLTFAQRPAFELGGGTTLVRHRDALVLLEVSWVYDRGPYRLEVFGEPDRHGTYDVSGVTILVGLRFNPPASGL